MPLCISLCCGFISGSFSSYIGIWLVRASVLLLESELKYYLVSCSCCIIWYKQRILLCIIRSFISRIFFFHLSNRITKSNTHHVICSRNQGTLCSWYGRAHFLVVLCRHTETLNQLSNMFRGVRLLLGNTTASNTTKDRTAPLSF